MIIFEDSMHGSVDASDLGLKPGDFPKQIEVDIPGRGKITLSKAGGVFRRANLVAWEYEAADGFCLTVHND